MPSHASSTGDVIKKSILEEQCAKPYSLQLARGEGLLFTGPFVGGGGGVNI